jgi:hypothetical protein
MSFKIGENKYPQLAKVWEVEDKGTYAVVSLGTSRKDKKSDSYKNSNWKFVRFVGNAYEGIMELPLKSTIVIKSGTIDIEEYTDKDGNRAWPKQPKITVFAWEMPEPRDGESGGGSMDTPPVVEDDSSDSEFPF